MKKDLEDLGIIFKDTDSALRENEDIFKEHWGTVIPSSDNKFLHLTQQFGQVDHSSMYHQA